MFRALRSLVLPKSTSISTETLSDDQEDLRSTYPKQTRSKRDKSPSKVSSPEFSSQKPHHQRRPSKDKPKKEPARKVSLTFVPSPDNDSDSDKHIDLSSEDSVEDDANEDFLADICFEEGHAELIAHRKTPSVTKVDINSRSSSRTPLLPDTGSQPKFEKSFGPEIVQDSPMSEAPIKWRKGPILGCGSFGSVHLGMNGETGELLAVKQVPLGSDGVLQPSKELEALEVEISILKNLQHKNIVRYLGTTREGQMLNIFLEYVPGGSIHSLLSKFGPLPEEVIATYSRQILEGLAYLHCHSIIHRDIKGANILVDNDASIKLADFGASKKLEGVVNAHRGAGSLKGTIYWMAPEVVRQQECGPPADIWSLACTVIEMATGRPPWSQFPDQISALFHIAKTTEPPPLPDKMTDEMRAFLQACFKLDPKDRPTASELLHHPFISNARVVVPKEPMLAAHIRKSMSTPDYGALSSIPQDTISSCSVVLEVKAESPAPSASPHKSRKFRSNDLPPQPKDKSHPVANPFAYIRNDSFRQKTSSDTFRPRTNSDAEEETSRAHRKRSPSKGAK